MKKNNINIYNYSLAGTYLVFTTFNNHVRIHQNQLMFTLQLIHFVKLAVVAR